jgi:hypothetical protein
MFLEDCGLHGSNSTWTIRVGLWEAKDEVLDELVGNPSLIRIGEGLLVTPSEWEIRGNILTQAITRASPTHN